MTHTAITLFALSFVSAGWSPAQSPVPEKPAAEVPPRSGPPADTVREQMRREAARQIGVRERNAERLKELEAKLLAMQRGILILEPVEREANDAEPGDHAPVPAKTIVAARNFDWFLFGSTGDSQAARAHGEVILDRLIDQVEHTRPLKPEERRRLQLAGRGDLKRLFDRVEERRKSFDTLRTDPERCQQFLDSLLPLRRTLLHGPFNSESLFFKTLKKMVNDDKRIGNELRPSAPVLRDPPQTSQPHRRIG